MTHELKILEVYADAKVRATSFLKYGTIPTEAFRRAIELNIKFRITTACLTR